MRSEFKLHTKSTDITRRNRSSKYSAYCNNDINIIAYSKLLYLHTQDVDDNPEGTLGASNGYYNKGNCISGFRFLDNDLERTRLNLLKTIWYATNLLKLSFTTSFLCINIMSRLVQENDLKIKIDEYCQRTMIDEQDFNKKKTLWIWIIGLIAFRLAVKFDERPEQSYKVLKPKSGILIHLFDILSSDLSDPSRLNELILLEQYAASYLNNELGLPLLPEILNSLICILSSVNLFPQKDHQNNNSFERLIMYLAALSTIIIPDYNKSQTTSKHIQNENLIENDFKNNEEIMFVNTKFCCGAIINLALRILNQSNKDSSYDSKYYQPWSEPLAQLLNINNYSDIQFILKPLTQTVRDNKLTPIQKDIKKILNEYSSSKHNSKTAKLNVFGGWSTTTWT